MYLKTELAYRRTRATKSCVSLCLFLAMSNTGRALFVKLRRRNSNYSLCFVVGRGGGGGGCLREAEEDGRKKLRPRLV